jgi:hypothetical protein
MNATFHYTVLRLATDRQRGEVINVGVVLFQPSEAPRVVTMATLNKLRAIDATWDTARLLEWTKNIHEVLSAGKTMEDQLAMLDLFGFCDKEAIGMFMAETPEEVQKQLSQIKATFVANRSTDEKPKRERRTRLQTMLREQFSRMHVLGSTPEDLANHLVVANLPVPSQPELKNDFVYKNGVYRITQTIDYNVSPDGVHQKLQEACVKSTAADMAAREYGKGTQRYAVVDIPEEYRDATDSHLDLLLAQGFEVFHFSDRASMSAYLKKATPAEGVA